ncbi:MAG: hypothetical protein HEQ23_02280 [Tepidisphaera sp.]
MRSSRTRDAFLQSTPKPKPFEESLAPHDDVQPPGPSLQSLHLGLLVASAAMGAASLVLQNVTIAGADPSRDDRVRQFAAIVAGIGFLFAIAWAIAGLGGRTKRSAAAWTWSIAVLGAAAAVLALSLMGH